MKVKTPTFYIGTLSEELSVPTTGLPRMLMGTLVAQILGPCGNMEEQPGGLRRWRRWSHDVVFFAPQCRTQNFQRFTERLVTFDFESDRL
mmetsp:Transcript_97065/g.202813  ORF Transcript_97065/g.202813 Transcript_97065/m.202813 type:complete len:90 (-) Transcript_97065:171-440(-)